MSTQTVADPMERHYTIQEIAAAWAVSEATVRRLFEQEAGTIILSVVKGVGRRPCKTLRIPETVLRRVHERVSR